MFHMRCLRRILGISWQDKVTNNEVLSKAGIPSMYTLLRQRRLRWLGHVYRMEDGRIPKDLLYGELARGQRNKGRPQLRFKDVCKRDMKAVIMDTDNWEALATNRVKWKQVVSEAVRKGELSFQTAADDKRKKRKSRTSSLSQPQPAHIQPDAPAFQCQVCHRICKSRIGLHSHHRRCSSTTT